MRFTICKSIKKNNGKLSILIDVSTIVSDISTLVVYLDVQLEKWRTTVSISRLGGASGETANEIKKVLVSWLNRHGFDINYLKEHFVALTTDGACVLTGKKLGSWSYF